MCGRFTVRTAPRVKLPGVRNTDLLFEPRYNIAPSQEIWAVGDFGRGLEFAKLVWGLIPGWSADNKGFINARSETLEDKPSFSESFQKRRCLIPADGFYEWKRSGRAKQAFLFELIDELPFAFAGIWDRWGTREPLTTCAIITTGANEIVEPLHNRMPVILKPKSYETWLDPNADLVSLKQLLSPLPASEMTCHPVSSAVNYVDNEGPELVERVDHEIGTTPSLF